MTRRFLPFLSMLCLLALAPLPANAADIRLIDSPLCRLSLSGQITNGTTERLREQVETLIRRGDWVSLDDNLSDAWSTEDWRLCLDSPGGSLEEAARLAEYIVDRGIGTVLAPHATCLSACALVFMLGHANQYEAPGNANRRMHYTARLGFHAPSVPLDGITTLSRGDAERIMASLNEAVARILRLSNTQIAGQPPAIPPDLLERAYAHVGEESFFEIDTVAWSGRAAIPVFGFDLPRRIDTETAIHACTNLWRWEFLTEDLELDAELEAFIFENALRNAGQPVAPAAPDRVFVHSLDTGDYERACIVDRDMRAGLRVCGFDEFLSRALYRHDCNMPHYVDRDREGPQRIADAILEPAMGLAVFAPRTRLRDLPEAARQIDTRAATEQRAASDPPLHRSCWPASQRVRITRVNEYATLRAQPGFHAPIRARMPLHASVDLTSGPVLFGDSARTAACRSACQAAGTARDRPAPDVAACWLDNTLWFPARFDGQEGYVSGRFLAQ